ncbi:TetR/AcrR family transcriptional regulator [Vagococcus humatus]|uniref:HTH tetR-type domain-containing protein n=1 Tax=Vagococcus humatus TaxID=1889241 RepID=A0A3R9ZX58_9ENTE|nr:TetR family transcriptional regulator [Vagococcus humatus]RST89807.1 hypothetical protein C7P63_01635 [Vagococcus humatus]
MPKSTFLNLPEEKQALILDVALEEFSTHSFHEASVANIIEACQISRGSFYKYFEDLEELYYYLYQVITKTSHTSVLSCIQQEQGDLFNGLERYLEQLYQDFSDERYHRYFKQIILNQSVLMEKKLQQPTERITPHHFLEVIDLTPLTIQTEAELFSFFSVLVPMVHRCIAEYFMKDWTKEELMAAYQGRIHWLKQGVLASKYKQNN